jgi:hypothetical protein
MSTNIDQISTVSRLLIISIASAALEFTAAVFKSAATSVEEFIVLLD